MLDALACELPTVLSEEKDLGCAIFICFLAYCHVITTKPLSTYISAYP